MGYGLSLTGYGLLVGCFWLSVMGHWGYGLWGREGEKSWIWKRFGSTFEASGHDFGGLWGNLLRSGVNV